MELDFSDSDFDAYAPERTRATSMTAPRTSVKKRLLAWARALAAELALEGIELDVSTTDEHPTARNGHRVEAQSAYLFRATEARRAMLHAVGHPAEDVERAEHGHARIEVRIDAASLSLALWSGGDARIDLEHAAAMFAHPTEDVIAACEALPAGAMIQARASLTDRARRFHDLSPDEAATLAKQALESEVPVVIGVRVARSEATRTGALASWPEAALALGRLLHATAWSPASAARISERPSRRGKRERASKRELPREEPRPVSAIDRGTHVRALAGPFAGQAGVVQELDGKGGARVLFGLLTTRVEVGDLAVASKGRGRPVISSSHRKPNS